MKTETVDPEAEVADVRRTNPQGYGYLVRYWEDAKQGLDNTDRSYARVGHIYDSIPDPGTGTRGLGQTLVLLAELDVLSVLTHRSNATIYNLTSYDPDRLAAIGRLLDDR